MRALLRIFYPSWWAFVFGPMESRYDDEWHWRLRVIWCRIRGHRAGVVWFNPSGYEPDMTCKCCGEDLG